MNKKIRLMQSDKCSTRRCPFHIQSTGNMVHCRNDCQAWTVVTKGSSREDHSGGAQMIMEQAAKYGVEAIRTGPGGCMGHWEIPELGYCKRLWPNLEVVSPMDYEREK